MFVYSVLFLLRTATAQATTSVSKAHPSGLGSTPRTVTTWLHNASIPLESTAPEASIEDLENLKARFQDSRIVAMGEATHGTREFFEIKHRMMRFLAEKMGYTVFGIEANWPESLAINRYVLNGEGDPAQALAGLNVWTWNTKEMLEMVEWMRSYNRDPKHLHKLKFLGFDEQRAAAAISNLEAFLTQVDPLKAKEIEPVLDPLRHNDSERLYPKIAISQRQQISNELRSLLTWLDDHKLDYVQRSSQQSWSFARHDLEIAQQAIDLYSSGSGRFQLREQYMADNVNWILKNDGPNTKIMLWAHNAHLSRGIGERRKPMGAFLSETYGKKMIIVGFAFNEGSFQAVRTGGGLQNFTLLPAPTGTLESALASVGLPMFLVDLRQAPPTGPVADWLKTPQTVRWVGAVYSPFSEQSLKVVPRSFDMIIFIETTTAAHELQVEPQLYDGVPSG